MGERKLRRFVEAIQEIYGENLDSVVLYGSGAAGDESKYSDCNLMIVLKDLGLEELSRGRKEIAKWVRWGQPLPLVVTPQHIKSSEDVFPLEFLDMKENNKILYGKNPLEGVQIRKDYLRLQCEGELKGKILSLRQAYLLNGWCARRMRKIILKSTSSFFAIFRGILHLLGESSPRKKREVLRLFEKKTSLDARIFDYLLDVREGNAGMPARAVNERFGEYLTTIEKVTNLVDTLN